MVIKKKKTSARVLSVILTIMMAVTLLPVALLAETENASATTVSAPRVIRGGTTWECVDSGRYPQTEIVAEASQCGANENEYDYCDSIGVNSGKSVFHFREGSNRSYGYNETYAQLGGLIETNNSYMLCAASERTLSLDTAPTNKNYCGHSEARDLFLQILKKDYYDLQDKDMYKVPGETRIATGTPPSDSETKLFLPSDVKDYGVIWLTKLNDDSFVSNPKIVGIGKGKAVVLWEERTYANSKTGTTYYLVINDSGEIVQSKRNLNNTLLLGNADLAYKNGIISWVSNDIFGNVINILNVETNTFIKKTISVDIENTSFDPSGTFFAKISKVVNFWDNKGRFNIASYKDSVLTVYRFDQSFNYVDKICLDSEYSLFGSIINVYGNYYVMWGSSNSDAKLCIVKYNYNGLVLEKTGVKGVDCNPCIEYGEDGSYWGTYMPFDSGNCALAYNRGVICCNYARKMYSGHQSNHVLYFDTDSLERLYADFNTPYCSHSFDQDVIATSDGLFLFANHGDAYSRAFEVEKFIGLDSGTVDNKNTGHAGITEEQLYGEYCRYLLNNPVYKQMLGEVYADLEDIIYVSDDKAEIAARSTALKNGFIKNLKAIVGGYSGKFYSEKELEEAVAQDLLLAISGDKYLLSEITKETKKLYKADDTTYKLISQGTKTATAYKLYGIGFANGYKEDQIIQLIESVNKNWEPIGKVFKAAGISINAVETAVMLLETRDADMYTLNKIAGKVNEQSALHSGLVRIYNKNKGTTPEAMVKEWLKNDVFEFVADTALKFLSGAFAPVEFAFSLLGHAESLCSDGADMEDIDKAFIAWSNDNQIRLAVSDIIQKMALNYQNGGSKDYSDDFRFFKEAQFKALEVSVKYANEVGTSKQKAKLNKDYNKYKSLFNIDSYIQSCLANANADWKYKVVDGKAIIKGVNNGISTGSVSTIAERLGMVAYANDTTDSVLNVLVVPEEVDGYEVDSIDTRAFANNNEIEFAYIPETVTEVGKSAFEGCSNLKSVFFDNGIEIIAENAFADCSSLDSVELPVSLISVDSTAFTGTDSLIVYAVEGTEGQSFAENSNVTYESMEPEVTEISVDTLPTKIEYKMSEEEIDALGIKVTATLETGEKTDVSSDVYCYFKDKKLGNSKITVVYEDCETTYDVTVNADECPYTVSYENELGEEIADKVSGKAAAGTQLKLDIKEIKGYISEKSEQIVTIGADNDFVVRYSTEPATDIEAVQVLGVKDVVYSGKAFTPEPVLTYNGKTLQKGSDYYVTYDENINAGTGRLLITGTGDYCGTKTMEFQIKPVVAPQKKISANLYGYDDFKVSWSSQKVAGATVKYKVEYKRYGGNWYTIYKGTTATSVKKANLTDGVRYAFRVTPYVTVDNKNYYGKSKSTGYIYTLKKLNRPTVKKSSKYYTRVYWNNISGETGYEIARSKYSTKKFVVVKRASYKYKSTTIKTPRNVKYYYKIRAYKTVDGKRIYGPWSFVYSYRLK